MKKILCLCLLLASCSAGPEAMLKKMDRLGVSVAPARVLHDSLAGFRPASLTGSPWSCEQDWRLLGPEAAECEYTFTLNGEAPAGSVAVRIDFSAWSPEEYLLIPGAAYDGNRFRALRKRYPPFFDKSEYDAHAPATITDVPRLNVSEGLSRMELGVGDMTTPGAGIYFPATGQGLWILTEQQSQQGNVSLTFEENGDRTEAFLLVSAACLRDSAYRHMRLIGSPDTLPAWRPGEKVTLRLQFHLSRCDSPIALSRALLPIRKNFGSRERVEQLPFSAAFDLVEHNYNTVSWDPARRYYALGDRKMWCSDWQLGWVGGGMVTLPLSLCGQPLSVERSQINYDRIITESQAPSGFFYTCGNGRSWCSDCFGEPLPDELMLVRKNADFLYFIYKYALAKRLENPAWQMPIPWQQPLERFCNAFVSLWDNEGQFGQLVDIRSGAVVVGETSSAVMAIGGLALAGAYKQDPDYLRVAREAAKFYYENYLREGLSNGGPGEILQNPDAESTFAFLESYMALYDVTGEKQWLRYAEDAAALAATWMVSYDYRFPERSTFGKLGMKTTGAVWASTQNKHAAPGICTLSGDALLKLYRATGNPLYLDMLEDVAHNLMQYISRKDRPVMVNWDASQPSVALPLGWVNERVNMSDWEGAEHVGEVFYGTTWADVSVMLTTTEVPGVYVDLKKGLVTAFDHVKASLEGETLTLENPTRFDARVRVFVESDPAKPYPQGTVPAIEPVLVEAGQTIQLPLVAKAQP